jgi:hypothetical protein
MWLNITLLSKVLKTFLESLPGVQTGLSGPKNIILKARFTKVQGMGAKHGHFRADRAGRRARIA